MVKTLEIHFTIAISSSLNLWFNHDGRMLHVATKSDPGFGKAHGGFESFPPRGHLGSAGRYPSGREWSREFQGIHRIRRKLNFGSGHSQKEVWNINKRCSNNCTSILHVDTGLIHVHERYRRHPFAPDLCSTRRHENQLITFNYKCLVRGPSLNSLQKNYTNPWLQQTS